MHLMRQPFKKFSILNPNNLQILMRRAENQVQKKALSHKQTPAAKLKS